MLEIRYYKLSNNKKPFAKWLENLDFSDRHKVMLKLDRIQETGNLGDYKNLGDGVFEFRLHFASGYRIYFGKDGNTLIILLCGGDKNSQSQDIKKAKEYWSDYIN